MYTTYHLKSAQEVSSDLLDSIKATFKSKPITIIVEEDKGDLTSESEMAILEERLKEDESTYLTSDQSGDQLRKKYGL